MTAIFKILNHTTWDKNCTWIASVGFSYRNRKLNTICKISSGFWETLSQRKISIIPKFQNIAKIQFWESFKIQTNYYVQKSDNLVKSFSQTGEDINLKKYQWKAYRSRILTKIVIVLFMHVVFSKAFSLPFSACLIFSCCVLCVPNCIIYVHVF